jgi:hypothetical protein
VVKHANAFFLLYLTSNIFSVSVCSFELVISQSPEECAPEAMSKCTDPLKVVTDNKDLGFATSHKELQEMCP